MFRSLLVALTFSAFSVPAAQASDVAAPLSGFHLPSGRVAASAAEHRRGKSSGGSKSSKGSKSARPAAPSREPAPDSRSTDSSGRDDGRSAPADDNRGGNGRSEDRSQDRGQGEDQRAREAGDRAPAARAMPGQPAAGRVGGAAANPPDRVMSDGRRAAGNYRGVYKANSPGYATSGRNDGQADRVRHSNETARSHRDAAYGHRDRHGGSYVRHEQFNRWHDNWNRHGYHHSVWYRPHTWYRPWYPGAHRYWYHGVFVYGPGPVYASHGGGGGGGAPAPKREVDHEGQFSLGVRAGSYLSGYTNGASYGDFGMGLAARYRVVDPLGLELQWNYHDDTWSSTTERIQQPLSASVQLFALPWTRVNPYLVGGITLTNRNIDDDIGGQAKVTSEQAFWGPHIGAGLDLNLTDKVSLNFDVRAIGYLNREAGDIARPGAAQANMGLNFYF